MPLHQLCIQLHVPDDTFMEHASDVQSVFGVGPLRVHVIKQKNQRAKKKNGKKAKLCY
jgi:hypothetical protein